METIRPRSRKGQSRISSHLANSYYQPNRGFAGNIRRHRHDDDGAWCLWRTALDEDQNRASRYCSVKRDYRKKTTGYETSDRARRSIRENISSENKIESESVSRRATNYLFRHYFTKRFQIHLIRKIQISTTVKKDKIIYWISTIIVTGVFLWSALNFAFNEEMKGAFAHLGLPNWFRIELTIAKITGTIVLLFPMVPHKIKEFAYAGFAITLISAAVAHLSSGDSVLLEIGHSFFFVSLVVSYIYYQRIRKSEETFQVKTPRTHL
jgi:DoxX-like family